MQLFWEPLVLILFLFGTATLELELDLELIPEWCHPRGRQPVAVALFFIFIKFSADVFYSVKTDF